MVALPLMLTDATPDPASYLFIRAVNVLPSSFPVSTTDE
jgi:hypothetical protein